MLQLATPHILILSHTMAPKIVSITCVAGRAPPACLSSTASTQVCIHHQGWYKTYLRLCHTVCPRSHEVRIHSRSILNPLSLQDLHPPHVSHAVEHMATCCAQLLPVTRLQQEAVKQQLAKVPSGRLQMSFKRRTGQSPPGTGHFSGGVSGEPGAIMAVSKMQNRLRCAPDVGNHGETLRMRAKPQIASNKRLVPGP